MGSKSCRAPETSGQNQVSLGVPNHRVAVVGTRSASLDSPEPVAVGIQFGQKNVFRPIRGQDRGAELRGAEKSSGNVDVFRIVQGQVDRVIRRGARGAGLHGPFPRAGAIQFGHKNVPVVGARAIQSRGAQFDLAHDLACQVDVFLGVELEVVADAVSRAPAAIHGIPGPVKIENGDEHVGRAFAGVGHGTERRGAEKHPSHVKVGIARDDRAAVFRRTAAGVELPEPVAVGIQLGYEDIPAAITGEGRIAELRGIFEHPGDVEIAPLVAANVRGVVPGRSARGAGPKPFRCLRRQN